MNAAPQIGVAICTPSFRRRALLLQLFDALNKLELPSGVSASVIVVDNSPDNDLADLSSQLSILLRMPAQIAHEGQPGLSAARNKLLELAFAAHADFIAFVDDDERPEPDWLLHLIATQRAEDADIVTGTVIGELPASAPRWMAEGRFFDHLPAPTFRGVSGAHTATTLVRVSAIGETRFESAFALTGGEDTMFFTRLETKGAKPARTLLAVVKETVPPDRAQLSWLWRRWTRTGSSEARLELVRRPGVLTRLYCLSGGLARFVVGVLGAAALSPFILTGRPAAPIRRLKTAARGLGFMRGAFGHDVVEYAR